MGMWPSQFTGQIRYRGDWRRRSGASRQRWGYLSSIIDRSEDFLKGRGEQISYLQIEEVLLEFDGLVETVRELQHYWTRGDIRADTFDYIEECDTSRLRRGLETQATGGASLNSTVSDTGQNT